MYSIYTLLPHKFECLGWRLLLTAVTAISLCSLYPSQSNYCSLLPIAPVVICRPGEYQWMCVEYYLQHVN